VSGAVGASALVIALHDEDVADNHDQLLDNRP
jgi:hypothetical protein